MNALERIAPHLTGLAAEVLPGSRIHYRDKTYWLGDLQLTYSTETNGGRWRDLGAPTSKANIALAERILRACLAARTQPAWGTIWERQRRILIGLREDTLPAFRPRHYCHWRHESLDDGWLFRSFGGRLRACAGLRLVGAADSEEAEGATLEAAIETLWARLAPAGEHPTWHGELPAQEASP